MQDILLENLKKEEETVWINPNLQPVEPMKEMAGIKFLQMKAAQNRLLRFMPYIADRFPETRDRKGIIESDILPIPVMERWLKDNGATYSGKVYLKDDAHLPIAGSVKARGGIYEVLCHAEHLASSEGLLELGADYSVFGTDEFKEFFGKYTIQVGSTGNLGLSIGIMSASLGFKVVVHMSADAAQWKKDLLRTYSVDVREYDGNYTEAVARGRALSDSDPMSYFVDDENSMDLFLGYSTVGFRLKIQLFKAGVEVDDTHPLFVYIPCGVGGAPGGITYGLKQMYGRNVHCFFVEPTKAPCFMLAMNSGMTDGLSIYDIGLDGKTIADGLAVGKASGLVCRIMDGLVSGSMTVTDESLTRYRSALNETEGICIETSAAAGFHGLTMLHTSEQYQEYIRARGIEKYMDNATHIVWATGGGLALS